MVHDGRTQPVKFYPRVARATAFTLVELLVSMAVVLLLLLVLVSITDATAHTWKSTTSTVEQFREARNAFETMTQRLSQATLNTYWDYNSPNNPNAYVRQSELRFISGPAGGTSGVLPDTTVPSSHAVFFQAPLGSVSVAGTTNFVVLNTLVNTVGYFVDFGSDQLQRPPFLTPQIVPYRYRFRLMEMVEPSDSLTIYKYTSGYVDPSATPLVTKNSTYTARTWYTDPLGSYFTNPGGASALPIHAVADNIIALYLLPKLSPSDQAVATPPYDDTSLAPGYLYDSSNTGAATTVSITAQGDLNSKNQLPPLVQVTMVAVDEPSYQRYQVGTSRPTPDPLFTNSPFVQAAQYKADLQALQTTLTNNKLTYRVFTTDVSIKSAKWSRAQTQ